MEVDNDVRKPEPCGNFYSPKEFSNAIEIRCAVGLDFEEEKYTMYLYVTSGSRRYKRSSFVDFKPLMDCI